jgi:hypothetical protein
MRSLSAARIYAVFGSESFGSARSISDSEELDEYIIFNDLFDLGFSESRTFAPLDSYGYHLESAAPGTALQSLFSLRNRKRYLRSHVAPLGLSFAPVAEDLDEAFNRAAELLSTRHRLEEVAPYISRLVEAEEAVTKAEVERQLTEAFQNRQAMAALMADDWLGLRILDELSSVGSLRFSELTALSNDDKDAMAAALSRLAATGMLEIQGNRFICTRRGADVLQNLGFNVVSSESKAAEGST